MRGEGVCGRGRRKIRAVTVGRGKIGIMWFM